MPIDFIILHCLGNFKIASYTLYIIGIDTFWTSKMVKWYSIYTNRMVCEFYIRKFEPNINTIIQLKNCPMWMMVSLLLSRHRYLTVSFGYTAETWLKCQSGNVVTAKLKDSVVDFRSCLKNILDHQCSDYSRKPLFSPVFAAHGVQPQQASLQSWLFRLYVL